MRTADTTISRAAPPWSLLLFGAVLWGQLFFVLAPSWSGATYYDYGWLVPPFAVIFAWRRWQEIDFNSAQPLALRGLWTP